MTENILQNRTYFERWMKLPEEEAYLTGNWFIETKQKIDQCTLSATTRTNLWQNSDASQSLKLPAL